MTSIRIPAEAARIIERLNAAGYEAYVVGGCVRDSLLGREPVDWDITTSALPETVKSLFSHTVDTGLKHGTVTVIENGEHFEVTTYRIDGEYKDGRHPDSVEFTSSLEEDLRRRDFTINAMAYSPEDGLVDIFGGRKDLEDGIIRCVGEPRDRFNEDALRMMRAVRFAAQLDFSIEDDTREAIACLADNLTLISAERIRDELCKLLVSDRPRDVMDLYELGLTRVFLPEFDVMMECEQNTPHHKYTVGRHTVEAIAASPRDIIIRLVMLLHDVGKPAVKTTDEDGADHFKKHAPTGAVMARGILRRLHFDNDTIAKVTRFVEYHDDRPELTEKSIRRAIVKIGSAAFPAFFDIQVADIKAQSDYRKKEKEAYIAGFRQIYEDIIRQQDCIDIHDMAVSGRDIISLGVQPGPLIGDILASLFDEVVENPSVNTKDYLQRRAKEIAGL